MSRGSDAAAPVAVMLAKLLQTRIHYRCCVAMPSRAETQYRCLRCARPSRSWIDSITARRLECRANVDQRYPAAWFLIPTSVLAWRTGRPGAAGPKRRAGERIRSAPAPEPQHVRPALIERRITAVLASLGSDRTPAITGSVGVRYHQRDHHKTDWSKTHRAHDCAPLYQASRRHQHGGPTPRRHGWASRDQGGYGPMRRGGNP